MSVLAVQPCGRAFLTVCSVCSHCGPEDFVCNKGTFMGARGGAMGRLAWGGQWAVAHKELPPRLVKECVGPALLPKWC